MERTLQLSAGNNGSKLTCDHCQNTYFNKGNRISRFWLKNRSWNYERRAKGKLIKCIKQILIILVVTIIIYEQNNLNIFADAVLIIPIRFLINWSFHYKWIASTYIDIFMRHKDINIKVCWSSNSHFWWLFDFIGGISISVQLSNKKQRRIV